MRFLFAFLIILAGMTVRAETKPPAQSHPVEHQTKDKAEAGQSASPDSRNGNVVTFVEQKGSEQKDERGYWRKVASPEILPIWIASLIAVIGVIVAVYTLRAIEREAKEIRAVASAASLNAQAVINAERPWLVVATFFEKDKPELCRFECRNQGNTPAKIISISANPHFVTNPSTLLVQPDYSFPVAMPDLTLIVHSDSFQIGHGIRARQFIESRGRWESVLWANEFLVYYGNVVYQDTLYPESSSEGIHETRWCFVYQPGGDRLFLRGGPEEYNRYT
jgi:hypothetical protein